MGKGSLACPRCVQKGKIMQNIAVSTLHTPYIQMTCFNSYSLSLSLSLSFSLFLSFSLSPYLSIFLPVCLFSFLFFFPLFFLFLSVYLSRSLSPSIPFFYPHVALLYTSSQPPPLPSITPTLSVFVLSYYLSLRNG